MAEESQSTLNQIDPDDVDANPDNPRLIFREKEMNQLLESIREVGIQVPLTMYSKGDRYVLLDGERRWRCARRLNLAVVPAIIQPEPTRLENLLKMFNIHNVRSDWDLMPMAYKLADVQEMLEAEGKPADPKSLSGVTGLSVPTVRRALELLDLPKKYQDLLMQEAEKPKDQQIITADVFVEINKSQRVVEKYQPEVFDRVTKEDFVDTMVDKYQDGVVNNVVRFRDISKIARVERTGELDTDVEPTLVRLVQDPKYKIEDAYAKTVKGAYELRDLSTRTDALLERLRSVPSKKGVSKDLKEQLLQLRREIDRLLGSK